MNECSKCGNFCDRLFDVVLNGGIVRLCESCVRDEKVPVVRKPLGLSENQNQRKTVYERMALFAGVNPDTHQSFEKRKTNEQDEVLKDIVEKNIQNCNLKCIDDSVLIRNFHWKIMMARRSRKITQAQLAREISESEELLKMVEKGIVPERSLNVVEKLEAYLGIVLFNGETKKKINNDFKKEISFDPVTTKLLTIEDLKEMKKKQEEEIFSKKEELIEETKNSIFEKEELSQEEIDDLIFGRK